MTGTLRYRARKPASLIFGSMMDDVYCTWLSFSFGLREIPYCTRTTVQAQAPYFDRYVPAAKIVRRWRCDPETTARSTVTLPITEAKVREWQKKKAGDWQKPHTFHFYDTYTVYTLPLTSARHRRHLSSHSINRMTHLLRGGLRASCICQ